MKVYTLKQICDSLSRCIDTHYKQYYLVEAEMNKLNYYAYSGHAYPDLVFRENNQITAEMRAVIWRDQLLKINAQFIEKIGEPLKDGIKILCKAKLNFDAKHGVSLQIADILTEFTLGDLAIEKKKTIEALKEKGILWQNKQLHLAQLLKKLAIISVESSKGYQDFMSILQEKASRFNIYSKLFPAVLQGDEAVQSIAESLDAILNDNLVFDAVVILRGGGGDVGLTCYNHPFLAEKVALFPIPILAGIGHKSNETVVEMAAHTSGITPSAIAHFLTDRFVIAENKIQTIEKSLQNSVNTKLKDYQFKIQWIEKNIKSSTIAQIKNCYHVVRHQQRNLVYLIKSQIIQKNAALDQFELRVSLSAPNSVLKKGYVLLYKDNQPITQLKQVAIGQTLTAKLYKGKIEAEIKKLEYE
jgi:exodeoxyribonuclease VII large subunit